jgi:hypothetical protein
MSIMWTALGLFFNRPIHSQLDKMAIMQPRELMRLVG